MNLRPRLLVDLSVAPPGGAGTYAEGFVAGLLATPGADRSDLVVLVDAAWAADRSGTIDALRGVGANVDELALPRPGTWEARLRRGTTTRDAVARHRPDLSFFPRDVAPRGVGPYVVLANNLFAWRSHDGAEAVGGRLTATLLRRAARRTALEAAAVLAVSGPMAAAVAPTVDVRAIVHHGCSLPEGPTAPRRPDGRPRAMTLGNLYANKRFDLAVRGVAASRTAGAPLDLVVVGGNQDGPFARSLDDLGRELLGDPVVQGPAHGDALPAAYRDADVLVVTTSFESFCFPLVEAMRSGCAVVAPASDLVDEICGPHAATYREGDVASLADSLAGTVENLAARAEGGRRFARRYTWQATVDRTLDELRAVAAGR